MRAAVFTGRGGALEIAEIPTPEPGPGELRVRVAACGLCHTDLHYLDHGTPTFKTPPLVLGHEISGRVDRVGPGVAGWSEGEPVLLPAVLSCGSCPLCRAGRENICENSRMFGNHIDGGFAEHVIAPARDVFRLPPELPLAESAIIADALTTPFHAVVRRGRVVAGDWVVVLGCGGVGLNLVQIAAAVGARVVAVDLAADKLEWARRLGAEIVVDASREERVDKTVRRVTAGGADIAFEAVGKPATQERAFDCVRLGGRLVLVGYSPEAMTFNSGRAMFREIEVTGSLGCRPVDYPRVLELARRGRVKVAELVTHRVPLEAIGHGLDALRSGAAVRAIVEP